MTCVPINQEICGWKHTGKTPSFWVGYNRYLFIHPTNDTRHSYKVFLWIKKLEESIKNTCKWNGLGGRLSNCYFLKTVDSKEVFLNTNLEDLKKTKRLLLNITTITLQPKDECTCNAITVNCLQPMIRFQYDVLRGRCCIGAGSSHGFFCIRTDHETSTLFPQEALADILDNCHLTTEIVQVLLA